MNAGMDLSHITFINGGYEYMIYQTYNSEDEKFQVGISVKNTKTSKTSEIKGKYSSIIGSLHYLKEKDLLEEDDRI
jgi:hypothetical protein